MSDIVTFEDLLNSTDSDIQDLVEKAKHIKLLLIENKISQDEFEDLFSDLKNLKHIEENADTLVLIKKLKELMDIIESVRSWAP